MAAAARRLAASWLPPGAWAALILFLSSRPSDQIPQTGFTGADKLVHAGVYAILGALVARGLVRSGRRGLGVVAVAALAAGAFGLLDEWTQSFTPGRYPDLADAAADLVGATAGALAAVRYHRRRHASHPPVR
ncbi:MAG TPA: VanZ family protein [Kofleriaceae bacterium]|nr:VanZ family protein [Kofleriaceae bacterium]